MKDWVKSYTRFSEEYFNEIEITGFNPLEEHKDFRTKILAISRMLIDELEYKFDDNFTIKFASVLADLEKDKFDVLCDKKNIFYIYGSNSIAYIKEFDLIEDLRIDKEKQLKIVTFTPEFSFMPWLVSRGIIIHELIHIITGLGSSRKDENCVHQVARNWGFKIETEEANKYQKKKDKRIVETIDRLKAAGFLVGNTVGI